MIINHWSLSLITIFVIVRLANESWTRYHLPTLFSQWSKISPTTNYPLPPHLHLRWASSSLSSSSSSSSSWWWSWYQWWDPSLQKFWCMWGIPQVELQKPLWKKPIHLDKYFLNEHFHWKNLFISINFGKTYLSR